MVEFSILCKVYLLSSICDTLSRTVCHFGSEVEDYSLCGYCYSLKKEGRLYCGDETTWTIFIFSTMIVTDM